MATNRRTFIQRSAAATTAALVQPFLPSITNEPVLFPATRGYELVIMATDWGFRGNKDAFCAAAKKEGYDGIEVWWPDDEKAQDEIFNAVAKHNLKVAFLSGAWQENATEHLQTFEKYIRAAAFNKRQKPLYINCHSGRDYFSEKENIPFIQFTTQISKEAQLPIYHETHRGRMAFAAQITRNLIKAEPSMRLTLDISHWCVVHESLLDDQAESVKLDLTHTDHIHARVGFQEGPQVNDPRAPEWKTAVDKHFEWWDTVVNRKRKNGERVTFLTEFGPVDYMPALPYTRQPVADQWAINVHMMQLLRKRYS